MRRAHLLLRAAIVAPFAALPACDGCRGGKPYTPYTLEGTSSAPGSAAAPASAAAPEADAGSPAFVAVAGSAAPDGGKSWPLEGGAVEPPSGHAFAQGLVFDADGDQKPDLLAWSRSSDGLRGQIWFASGKAPAEGRAVATIPADVAGPGCTPLGTLTRIGASMVVFELDPHCSGRPRGRFVAVFRA